MRETCETITTTIGGGVLEVARHRVADPDAPTIVFLHEGLGSLSLWRDFPTRLADLTGCGTVVYSRHGYGRSERLQETFGPDYLHREALTVLPQLLDRFAITRPFLYGHSDGASIALIHAGMSGRPLRGLVIEAPHVFVEPQSIAGVRAAQAAFDSGRLAPGLQRHHRDAAATFHAWSGIWQSRDFRDWNIEPCLPAILAPVLMIQGRDDAYGTLAQLDRITAGLAGPHRRLVLQDCGHGPHREMTGRVLDCASSFIRNLTSPVGAAAGS